MYMEAKHAAIKFLIIQLLYYFKSTQLIFFMIPLMLAVAGFISLGGIILESFGLLIPLIELIPQNINYEATFGQLELENGLIKIYALVAFIIYLFELILSKIYGRHVEINDRFKFKHYWFFFSLGFLSFVIMLLGWAENEGTYWEAGIVFIMLYVVLSGFLLYGWGIVSGINKIIIGIRKAEFKFEVVKKNKK